MKRLIMLFTVFALLLFGAGFAFADVLGFEDADGTNWNQDLYGQPVYGPAGVENSYHGFDVTGWRVYNLAGVERIYGPNDYRYVGTNGNRSFGRQTYDAQSISRDTDFYFEGVQLATTDYGDDENPSIVQIIGYNNSAQVWSDTVTLNYNNGSPDVINFTSSYSDILVDQVSFFAWESYYYKDF
ncbi:MAG: hypothetical protein KKC46_22150, partial [Proteobacteria bacterium]|nr:hypothetical protein [Pseudomonadota bacterium]